jgi:hypothetical protein
MFMARRRQAPFYFDFISTAVPHKAEAQGLCRRLNDIAGEIRMM